MSKPTYEELEQKVKALEEVEARLRESEEKFRLAFHTNPDAINLSRVSDGLYIDINEGFTRSMGYTREEVVGKTSLELNIWGDPKDREQFVKGLMTVGYVDNLEARFRRKNGQVGSGLVSARVLRINQEDVILSITRDITERKQMEEDLRESEHRYRTLFEKTSDAIFVVDKRTGRYLDANEAAVQLTGRTLPEICQLMTKDISPEGAKERLAAVESANEPVDFGRVTFIRPDGTERIALLGTVPLDNEKVFGIAHDITDAVKLEKQLFQAQKMEVIGRLAGGIAHDFNNLLVPIIGYAQLGMMRVSPDDNLYTELEHIEKAAERAADLTRQILAFSSRQVLELRMLNLNEVIKDFQKMAQRLLKEDIQVNICLAPSLGQIKGDRAQIEQILMNLVINAGYAMPTGGALTIETANIFLDEAYFERYAEEKKPGHYVMLAVSDTGCGMDAETQKHIFEPFFTTKGRGKGTGLGLSTVFGIVKQHQGYIWVYSEPDKGTTFKVYLPQVEEMVHPVEITRAEPGSLYGTETILVVEDEEMVRKLVCETLAAYGYNVLDANSSIHALKLAAGHKEKIHLLLTDVIMPQMNGQELYQKIVATHPNIKLLYMSGYTDNIIVHHGILDGGIDFLQKPFTVNSLVQKVKEVLDR
jgi:two-component system cell cycle sensor histidine kinase/response regulator CckA